MSANGTSSTWIRSARMSALRKAVKQTGSGRGESDRPPCALLGDSLVVVNFCDIAAGKLDHRRLPPIGGVRLNQDGGTGGPGLGQGIGQVLDVIAGQFAPVRIGKMSI